MNKKNIICYRKRLLIGKFIVLLASYFYAEISMAAVCTFRQGWDPSHIKYIKMPDTLTIDATAPLGAILYSVDYEITSSDLQISDCPGPGVWTFFIRNGDQFSSNSVSETNIPGIGWKVYSKIRNTTTGYAPSPITWKPTPTGGWLDAGDYIRVELVKTKESVNNGILNPLLYASFGAYHDLNYYVGLLIRSNTTTKVIGKTCSVTGNKNKEVSFGSVRNKNLSNVTGVIRDTEREIDISLKCTPGTKVSITYDSINKDPVLQSSIINQGTAKGVYINFFDIGGSLGSSKTIITSSAETETIKQKVALYRYGKFVPGDISGNATYTLNYE